MKTEIPPVVLDLLRASLVGDYWYKLQLGLWTVVVLAVLVAIVAKAVEPRSRRER